MIADSVDTDPEIIEATHRDPRNVVLNVAKQESLGMRTSGANPVIQQAGPSVGANGWVSFSNEPALIPGQFSDDASFDQEPGNDTLLGFQNQ